MIHILNNSITQSQNVSARYTTWLIKIILMNFTWFSEGLNDINISECIL